MGFAEHRAPAVHDGVAAQDGAAGVRRRYVARLGGGQRAGQLGGSVGSDAAFVHGAGTDDEIAGDKGDELTASRAARSKDQGHGDGASLK